MKIYKLPQLADSNPTTEYRLGPENSCAGSVYMVYGRIRPAEPARKISCASGDEELVCLVKGTVSVRKGKSSFTVSAGEAFHAGAGETLYLETVGDEDAVYLAAGSLSAGAAKQAASEPTPDDTSSEDQSVKQPACADVSLDEDDEFEITTEDEPETQAGALPGKFIG